MHDVSSIIERLMIGFADLVKLVRDGKRGGRMLEPLFLVLQDIIDQKEPNCVFYTWYKNEATNILSGTGQLVGTSAIARRFFRPAGQDKFPVYYERIFRQLPFSEGELRQAVKRGDAFVAFDRAWSISRIMDVAPELFPQIQEGKEEILRNLSWEPSEEEAVDSMRWICLTRKGGSRLGSVPSGYYRGTAGPHEVIYAMVLQYLETKRSPTFLPAAGRNNKSRVAVWKDERSLVIEFDHSKPGIRILEVSQKEWDRCTKKGGEVYKVTCVTG